MSAGAAPAARTASGYWLAVGLLLAAGLLRLHRLDELPPPLYSDMGVNGLDALDVLAGKLVLFFPRNFGREPIFIYFQALLIALGGVRPFVFAFSGLVAGMLGLALAYRLHRELFGARIALIATALLAFSFWHLGMSRLGLRGVSLAPLLMACLYFLWRTLRDGRPRDAALAGAALGLTQYTYISARLLPVLIVLICLADWRRARERWRRLALAAAVALAVFAPLGGYFFEHRDELLRRAGDVSVFNPSPEIEGQRMTLREAVAATAGAFFVRGDANQRHAIAGRPIFDPLFGALFVAGTGLALWRSRRDPAYRWVLLWLPVMCLPSALSHESPNTFRIQSVAPAAFLFPALVLARAPTVVAVLAVVFAAVTTYRGYFQEWASDPRTYWAFDGNLPKIAALVQPRAEPWLYLSLDRRPTVELLAPRSVSEGRWYREESFGVPVPAHPSGDVFYVSGPGAALPEAAPAYLPGVVQVPNSHDALGRADFRAFLWPAAGVEELLRERRPLAGDMSPDFRLTAYRLTHAAGETRVDLFWQPLAARGPYDLYVHLRQASGAPAGQSDRLVWPIDGGPPREDLLLTHHAFRVPAGAYTAEAGAVHRSVADRSQLVGGPIGEVVSIPITVP